MDLHNWLVFASIAFIATITPGPAVLLISTQSLAYGPTRAIFGILGNISGLFIMSLLSVLGLSALVLCSTAIFHTVKILGSLYLIYLGIKLWKNGFNWSTPSPKTCEVKHPGAFKLYSQGLIIALSNPKAIAFTTALFPQFIDHNQPLTLQFSILVITFMALSFLCLLGYGLISCSARRRASQNFLGKYLGKLFGGAFVGSGVALATLTEQQ